MIEGVKIKQLKVFPDTYKEGEEIVIKPGFLMELLRADEGLLKKFGQSIFSVAYKGTIKAFHWHKKQDDLWFIATGQALIVLYDLRKNSTTFGHTEVIKAGDGDYKLVVIPAGVAHGYKVLSDEPVLLFYHATELYNRNNPDEERIPYNDVSIGFDWGD